MLELFTFHFEHLKSTVLSKQIHRQEVPEVESSNMVEVFNCRRPVSTVTSPEGSSAECQACFRNISSDTLIRFFFNLQHLK